MPKGLTTTELEASLCACGEENCDNSVIYMHSKCHPSAGAEVSYTKGEGRLVIKCQECKAFIADVAVATVN